MVFTAQAMKIRQEGSNVRLIWDDGKATALLPWQEALRLARAMYAKAKEAETVDMFRRDREGRLADTELLVKAGFIVNLGVPRKLMGEIVRQGGTGHGIPNRGEFGIPTVTKRPPKK